MTDNLESLKDSIGKSETAEDVVTASQVGRIAASMGADHPARGKGDPIPAGWHGAFFPPLAPLDKLREDGQPAGGGLLPPVPLPRRRLMGVRGVYHDALMVGDEMTKTTEVADIRLDDFGVGPVVSMTVRETIATARGPAVTDERDFQFFGEKGTGADDTPPSVPGAAEWRRTYESDPVMLFRSSAVRFNSHRVHYDRDYTTKVEGLPGLVVPVTLISSLMLELCRTGLPDRRIAGFDYRSIRRAYDLGPFTVHGAPEDDGAVLWATDHEGALAVYGEARFN